MWNFNQYADHTAVISNEGLLLSYSQLQHYGDEISKFTRERALVFCLCTNTVGSLAGYTGFLSHKQVPLLLDAKIDEVFLKKLVDIYHPNSIFMPKTRAERDHEKYGSVVWQDLGYAMIKCSDIAVALNPKLALLLTTSGSTGAPRIVRQSYDNLESNTSSIIDYLKIDQNERPVTVLPMHYTYGLSVINTHLASGATLLLTDNTIMQKEFWSFLVDHKATSFSGVPYTYQMLDRLRFERRSLPELKILTQAGGHLSKELQLKFSNYAKREGKNFVVMYGQAEATARISYLPADMTLRKIGSIGIAIPRTELLLEGEHGEKINSPNTEGELICKGEHVTLGYAECVDDLNKGDERHGVLHTGDLAYFDEDGYFYISGRKNRFLKLFGNRVSLEECEELIRSQFPLLDCACCGEDDRMLIYITKDLKSEVRDFISKVTHINFTAFDVRCVQSLPRNASGKILYSELK